MSDPTCSSRVITLTQGNIDNNHIYTIRPSDLGAFYPQDALGRARREAGLGQPLRLDVAGMSEPVRTDIPSAHGVRRARRFFRDRSWVAGFLARYDLKAGDSVLLERLGTHHYRITPVEKPPASAGSD